MPVGCSQKTAELFLLSLDDVALTKAQELCTTLSTFEVKRLVGSVVRQRNAVVSVCVTKRGPRRTSRTALGAGAGAGAGAL